MTDRAARLTHPRKLENLSPDELAPASNLGPERTLLARVGEPVPKVGTVRRQSRVEVGPLDDAPQPGDGADQPREVEQLGDIELGMCRSAGLAVDLVVRVQGLEDRNPGGEESEIERWRGTRSARGGGLAREKHGNAAGELTIDDAKDLVGETRPISDGDVKLLWLESVCDETSRKVRPSVSLSLTQSSGSVLVPTHRTTDPPPRPARNSHSHPRRHLHLHPQHTASARFRTVHRAPQAPRPGEGSSQARTAAPAAQTAPGHSAGRVRRR